VTDAARFAAGDCLRCGARLSGEYCAACGQRRARRLDVARVLRESGAKVVDLDNRAWRTLRVLVTRPGEVARAYAGGDRAGWTNPFLLLIAVATVFVFVVHALDIQLRTPWGPPPPELRRLANLALSATAYLMFLIFLPVAWVQSRLFRADGMNAAECYVFLLYWYSLHLLCTTLGGMAGALHGIHGGWLSALSLGLLVWCLSGFYRRFGPGMVAKAAVLYACYFAVFAALGVTLFTLARKLGFA
jgi:hypothetical protein